jgi:hypothetical protein
MGQTQLEFVHILSNASANANHFAKDSDSENIPDKPSTECSTIIK